MSRGETWEEWVFPTHQGRDWTREINTRVLSRELDGKEEKGWKGACGGGLTLGLFQNLETSGNHEAKERKNKVHSPVMMKQ